MTINNFFVLSQKKTPRLAIYQSYDLQDLAIAFSAFQTYSIPGRIWRSFNKFIFRIHMQGLFQKLNRFDELPLPQDALLQKIDGKLGIREKGLIYLFPYNPERKKFSAFLKDNDSTLYLKCAYGKQSRSELETEIGALKNIRELHFSTFLLPEIVVDIISDEFAAVIYKTIPTESKQPHKWSPKFKEISQELVTQTKKTVSLHELKWYHDVMAIPEWQFLLNDINSTSIIVSQNHGDFLPWNLKYHADKWYLFDWEQAIGDAPVLSDPIQYFTVYKTLLENKNEDWIAANILKFLTSCNNLNVQLDKYLLLGLGYQYVNNAVLSKEKVLNIARSFKRISDNIK